jgi:VCBS repeat-containing protein
MATNANDKKNVPITQTDRNGQTVTVYPNGGQPMIVITPKQINTLSEDKNGK